MNKTHAWLKTARIVGLEALHPMRPTQRPDHVERHHSKSLDSL